MTAFALKLASATFNTSLKGLRLPSRLGLAGEYLLGVSQAESIKNRANPSLPLTVQGVPTYNAHSVTVRSGASGYGFRTGIIPYDDATTIVVRKNFSLADTGMVVGGGVDANGTFWGFSESTNNIFHNGEGGQTSGAQRTLPAGGTIYFEAGVASQKNLQLATGGFGKLYYYSGGVQQVATSATLGLSNILARNAISIGSTSLPDTTANNDREVYFVAIYQRPLSTAEIDAAYAAIVAYYATLGITVV